MRSIFLKMGPLLAGIAGGGKATLQAQTVKAVSTSSQASAATIIRSDGPKRAHVYFLLDRSGSMAGIADDVIGGFNTFVKEQQSEDSDSAGLSMTLIQFDTADPKEVVFSACDISDVPALTDKTFRPRAATPLFDAMGGIISMAEAAEKTGKQEEQVVIVTFSDGMENASVEHSKSSIFAKIESKQKDGWTFVFLGANQDSYASGGGIGMKGANIQNFAYDGKGAQEAWSAISGATQSMRRKVQARKYDNDDFFDGVKTAEADLQTRKS
jgi:Mg-chelatase subunit ChlD